MFALRGTRTKGPVVSIRSSAVEEIGPGSTARFPQTSKKTVTRMHGGDVRCTLIILPIGSCLYRASCFTPGPARTDRRGNRGQLICSIVILEPPAGLSVCALLTEFFSLIFSAWLFLCL